ncbi:Imm50 family immunity protein [Streptomyces sp. NRRL WC-3742]|uniref:Imm50 family immunity protein n=1 Tax=Streptomyces sp. NRRL WC-3742 TaxID=1463934 RepID=UPI0004CB4D33|nr:Imm50 family immunity protein [Streptomyces sp. NRRL WC-3742]
MADVDWSAALADPGPVRRVLGSPPPPLTDFDLTSVLVDERRTSVTLRFFAFLVPSAAAHLWQERRHNAVEFTLVCTGVAGFAVDGWSGYPMTTATLTPRTGSVALAGRGMQITFTATGFHAEAPAGHLASHSQ